MVIAPFTGRTFDLVWWDECAVAPTCIFIPPSNRWAATRALRYRRRPAQRTASMRRARKLKYRWYR